MGLMLTEGLTIGGNRSGLRLMPVSRWTAPAIRHNATLAESYTQLTDWTRGTVTGGSNSATRTVETTAPPPGYSAYIHCIGWGDNGSVMGRTYASPLNLSNSFMRFTWRIVQGPPNMRDVQFRAATTKADHDAGNYWFRKMATTNAVTSTTANWVIPNVWLHESATAWTAQGTPGPLSSIGYVGVFGRPTGTGQPLHIDLAAMDVIPNASAKAKIVFWHDDSVQTGFNYLKAMLDPYGWGATEASEYGAIGGGGGAITWADVTAAKAAGWQFATHAYDTTTHTTNTPAQLTTQARSAKAVATAHGISNDGADYSWFAGLAQDQTTLDTLRGLYRSGRWNTTNHIAPDTLPPAEPLMIKDLLNDAATTTYATHLKPLVDNAIATKGLAQVTYHQELTPGSASATELALLLAYLDANRASIDVVTIDTALASSTL